MAKLKIYCGNYNGRQGRAVATTSQKKACELIGISMNHFRNYFRGDGSEKYYKECLENPETVYWYNLTDYSEDRPLHRVEKNNG